MNRTVFSLPALENYRTAAGLAVSRAVEQFTGGAALDDLIELLDRRRCDQVRVRPRRNPRVGCRLRSRRSRGAAAEDRQSGDKKERSRNHEKRRYKNAAIGMFDGGSSDRGVRIVGGRFPTAI
jgi:hypothetical protein